MAKGWKGESRRHSLARRGIKTINHSGNERLLKAPLESKSTKLPIQLSINVPSTDYDKKISVKENEKRIEETKIMLSEIFGGDTAVKGKGDYTSDGKLISEDVVIVESSMTKEDYLKNKSKLERFIKEKQKSWNQETIGYKFEGDFFIYPKFD